MSRGRERSVGGRKSWKRGTLTGPAPVTSRQPMRWLLTFILIGLLGWFFYWVWFLPRGARTFLSVGVQGYDRLILPQIPFSREDRDALLHRVGADKRFRALDLADLQDSRSMESLAQEFRQAAKSRDDVLTVYCSGHGLSEAGVAYLACSDYERLGGSGKLALRNLLQQLAEPPAALKLLILDAQWLAFDPRLGLAFNEFPFLVAEEVRQLPVDSNVWVLLSCGGLETNLAAHGLNQSLFGLAVSEGLSPLADQHPSGNANDFVSLHEFFEHVTRRCRGWCDPASGIAQTPLLLRAGLGEIRTNEKEHGSRKFELVYVRAPRTSEPASEEKTAPAAPSADKSDAAPASSAPAPQTKSTRRANPWQGSLLSVWNQAPPAAPPPRAPANPEPEPARPPDVAPKGVELSDAPVEQPANPKAADSKAADQKGADQKAADQKAADQKPAERPPDRVPTPGPAGPAPTPTSASVLRELWQLRDDLLERTEPTRITPLDFAPHLWRELEAILLYHERSLRSGRTNETTLAEGAPVMAPQRVLEVLGSDLRKLKRALSERTAAPDVPHDALITSRLLQAWNQFQKIQLPLDEKFRNESGQMVRRAEASWRKLRDHEYAATDYVRTVAQLGVLTELASPLTSATADFLNAVLVVERNAEELRLRTSEPITAEDVMSLVRAVDGLERHRLVLDQLLLTEVMVGLNRTEDAAQRYRLEALVSTPLLPAGRRAEIGNLLTQPREAPPSPPAEVRGGNPLAPSVNRWTRLAERLQLQQKLMALADPPLAVRMQQVLDRWQASFVSRSGAAGGSGAGLHAEPRELGQMMAEFYLTLRTKPTDRGLLLLDPRDASKLGAPDVKLPEFRLRLYTPLKLELEPLGPVALTLEKNVPQQVQLELRASEKWLLEDIPVQILSHNGPLDPAQLDVVRMPDGEIESREGELKKLLSYRITARVEQSGSGQEPLKLKFRARWSSGGQPVDTECAYQITLPQPNRIDLEMVRLAGGVIRVDRREPVELYPNRVTRYQLALVNHSGVRKTVKVELYRIPPRGRNATSPGTIEEDWKSQIVNEPTRIVTAELIATTPAGVDLPATPGREPITLAPVGSASAAPAANENKPADGGTAAPPPATPPPPPPTTPIDYGLLAVITDQSNPKDRWYKWIEFSVLPPERYVEAAAGYDQRQQRIVITVRPNPSGDIPLPDDGAVSVHWDPSEAQIPEQAVTQLDSQVTGTDTAELFAALKPDDTPRMIELDVDGYPRAFLFAITCREDDGAPRLLPAKPVSRTANRIRITGMSVEQQQRNYIWTKQRKPAPPAKPGDPPPPTQLLEGENQEEPAIFQAPSDPILVKLRADLPVGYVQAQKYIQISIAGAPKPQHRLYTDRQFEFQLVRLGPEGLIEFRSAVRDHAVLVNPGALANQLTQIEARNVLARNEEVSSIRDVLLDKDPPIIATAMVNPRPVPKEGKARLALTVQDTSGIAQIGYELTTAGTREFGPTGPKKISPPVYPASIGHFAEFDVDCKGLEPGTYTVLVQVTDKIGLTSELKPVTLQIAAPAPVTKRPGVIRGRLLMNGEHKVNGLLYKVIVQGPVTRTAKVDGQGVFEVRDLPEGEYTIRASGALPDGKASGEMTVKPSPPDKVEEIPVAVTRK